MREGKGTCEGVCVGGPVCWEGGMTVSGIQNHSINSEQ